MQKDVPVILTNSKLEMLGGAGKSGGGAAGAEKMVQFIHCGLSSSLTF